LLKVYLIDGRSREPEESTRLVLHAPQCPLLSRGLSSSSETHFILGLGAGMLRLGVTLVVVLS
jgi:hypothetical protein